ncbi:hypothetical protein GF380_05170 [Candidatus Uhrbacteria bacterium]|nr:hypothetical protein [Candidatus Uhrbacteria bacterium]MBD3284422.1 hypothetical protein [Candidatus Uhrbacteria bacterium]
MSVSVTATNFKAEDWRSVIRYAREHAFWGGPRDRIILEKIDNPDLDVFLMIYADHGNLAYAERCKLSIIVCDPRGELRGFICMPSGHIMNADGVPLLITVYTHQAREIERVRNSRTYKQGDGRITEDDHWVSMVNGQISELRECAEGERRSIVHAATS